MTASPVTALTVSGLISLTNISLSCVGGFFIQRYVHFGAHTANPDAPEYKRVRIRAKTQRIVFIGLMIGFTITIGLVRSQARLEEIAHSLSAYLTLMTHLADAILDRLMHNAHRVILKGESMRKTAPNLDPS